MSRTLQRGVLVVLALIAVVATAIWVTAKPYQQDRVLVELGLKSS